MKNQKMKFLVVGVLNTIVGYSIYFICLQLLDLNFVMSLTASHIIGVIHSYIWNNKWTFNAKEINFENIFKFCSVYLVTFIVNLLILSLLVKICDFNKLISQGFALFFTTIISFIGHKYWSFNKK